MREKYKNIGLNYDLIIDKYPDINEYEEIVNAYLSDPFFKQLEDYIDNEDYSLAKDALKGLFVLAQELLLYPLYTSLMDVYEDIDEEIYKDIKDDYYVMMDIYNAMKGVFSV